MGETNVFIGTEHKHNINVWSEKSDVIKKSWPVKATSNLNVKHDSHQISLINKFTTSKKISMHLWKTTT